ncbi:MULTISPECIES: hypothetical protein [Citrobacter]|uniref:hypothetical protein n=1 Tax=Citrobacter TaxID=544 RepID=UPI001660318B|nr:MULTISPECIES: hypothetical protein [Citrobacter]MBA4711169.1 hypothetical protein [Citrobacter pasteurii]MBD0799699.1 hypothetical protein [Citrobacter sp. C6_1]MBD0809519.1 hypothetical protein [Citrobacter sp. C6_2]
MNWIEMLWAILTFVSVILFICGSWVAHYKIRLLNYIMLTLIVIYCAEMMQTITHLTKTGYLFRMLTWTVQASFIAVSIYRAWPALWLTRSPRVLSAGKIAISLMLMSCLSMLVLK